MKADTELEEMSVKDLRALREAVDDAIRAAIVRGRQQSQGIVAKPPEQVFVDLERERDAWKASRR